MEYEHTADGLVRTELDRILLNGSHVCMLVPGSEGPEGVEGVSKASQVAAGSNS